MPETEATPIAAPAPTPVARTTAAAQPPPKLPAPTPPPAQDALLLALLFGVVAAGAASILRKKFPGKPGDVLTAFQTALTCDTCISSWASAATVAVWWYTAALPITKLTVVFFGSVWLAAVAICLTVLKLVQALTRVGT